MKQLTIIFIIIMHIIGDVNMKREKIKISKKETESEQKPDMSGAQYDVCNRFCSTVLINMTMYLRQAPSMTWWT